VRTFYGYFYNEPEKRWKLYASAQEPAGRKNMSGTLDSTGSFCEIPGPPAVERSGDVVREIKRRGWFYGSDQSWYRAQLGPDDADAKDAPADEPGDKAANNQATDERPARKQKPRSKAAESMQAVPEAASAQRFYYTKDYLTDGWIGMAAGGIESYVHDASTREMPTQKNAAQAVPEYLRPEKTAQLFDLPVAFGQSRASAVAADHAVIDYEITKTGPNSTTYYYRLFVAHDHGKSWDYRSGSFKTP